MTNQDEIIRMAREAGFFTDGNSELCCKDYDGVCTEELERFAALVAAHERRKLEFAPGNGKLYNLGYDAGYKAAWLKHHKPNEDCECRKCMEHFTPEPDNQREK